MKPKKRYILFISMLLLTSALVGTIQANSDNETGENENLLLTSGADLPVWNTGDKWEYRIEIEGFCNYADVEFDIVMPDLEFEVKSTSGSNYKLHFDGSLTGSGTWTIGGAFDLSGTFKNTNIHGDMYVRKSDLALVSISNGKITGQVQAGAIPLTLNADLGPVNFANPLQNMQFPLNVGDAWTAALSPIVLEVHINQPAIVAAVVPDIYMELDVPEHNVNCVKTESKNGYDTTYKVSTGSINYWYAPDAKNVVYAEKSGTIRLLYYNSPDYYYELTHFKVNLESTNIEPPNTDPNKPNKPTGDSSGVAGVSMSFCTSGTDPDGHKVKYGFDFGDSTGTKWTDLVDSGTQKCKSHTFTSAGTYKVKAKTQDSKGAESGWSSEFSVTIRENQVPDTPDTPEGPTAAMVGESLTYSTDPVTDDDGDDVQYKFSWGDGSDSGWISNPSGVSHTYTTKGTFSVKVKARDVPYHAESGWSGTLGVTIDNNEPVTPAAPTGPVSGQEDKTYTYKATTTDPDGHQILYKFDWGDGLSSDWVGPKASGAEASATHKFTDEGDYSIKVKAKDEYGMETDWSEPLVVHMPKSKTVNMPIIQKILELFPNVFQFLQQLINL